MPDAPPHIRLVLDADSVLARAAAYAVEFCARRCGMSDRACADVTAATEEAVHDTFALLGESGQQLAVEVQGFEDRLEVVLEHRGEALPTAGLDTFLTGGSASSPTSTTGLSLMARVDRVLYHSDNGLSRTTLVKYLSRTSKET